MRGFEPGLLAGEIVQDIEDGALRAALAPLFLGGVLQKVENGALGFCQLRLFIRRIGEKVVENAAGVLLGVDRGVVRSGCFVRRNDNHTPGGLWFSSSISCLRFWFW